MASRRTLDYSLESRTTTSSTSSSSRPSGSGIGLESRRPTELEKWEYDLANRRNEREMMRDTPYHYYDGNSRTVSGSRLLDKNDVPGSSGFGSSSGIRSTDYGLGSSSLASSVRLPDAHRGYTIRSPVGDSSYSYDRTTRGRPGAGGSTIVEETRTSTRTYRS